MLFTLQATRQFAERVAQALDIPLALHEEREFEDGEHKVRPLENVLDRDVYLLQSLHGVGSQTINDKLVRLLFFAGALRDSGARRVTAVIPYLCYSRKDRRTKPYDPVSTRYIALVLEAVGIDRVVTMDVHNLAAYQNAFRCATEHLEARHVFLKAISSDVRDEKVTVFSPDAGGVKRAERFRELLEIALQRPVANGFMEKKRSGGVVSGELLVGDVRGSTVVLVDDLIAGGVTIKRAALACRAAGAARVIAAVTHGVFSVNASNNLSDPALDRLYISDTVPPENLNPDVFERKVEIISVAPFIGEAIRRMYQGRELFDMGEAYDY